MKRSIVKNICAFILLAFSVLPLAAKIVVYPAPEGAPVLKDFSVSVRQGNSGWQTIPVYATKVDQMKNTDHSVSIASMAWFDFSGTVQVKVKYNKGIVSSQRIRPLSYRVEAEVNNNELTFTLNEPRNLSIEVNNDIFHNLHLFANALNENVPRKKKAKNLVYFGPGVHTLPGNELLVKSGTTVYVDGSAFVQGTLRIKDAHDVKVVGRGYVGPVNGGYGVSIENSRRVLVDGIALTQCPTGGSDSVTIHNVKSMSWYGWGDGLNVFASSNVLFDGVFCRNSDDCTTVYATRKGYTGSSRNIIMQNSTLWADVAHPIFLGIHGNVERPDTIEACVYRNIDILDHNEVQLDYQGCLAINSGDENLIRNIRFEDIRIENFRKGQLVNLRIFYNKKYCKAPGRAIEDVVFKDVNYHGCNAELSIIEGYNDDRKVKDILFQNFSINGTVISDDMPGKPRWYNTGDIARIYTGVHVDNVRFIK